MAEMKVDNAIINFINNSSKTLYIWTQFTECYKCPLLLWKNIVPYNGSNGSNPLQLLFNTNYGLEYAINEDANSSYIKWCETSKTIKDHSISQVIIHQKAGNDGVKYICDFTTQDEGRNNIWPLIVAAIIYIVFAIVFYVGRRFYYQWRDKRAKNISFPTDPIVDAAVEEKKRKRLKSLDCFRGITILMMIFVNYGAGDYGFLDHAAWDGLNFADIIFPWFIFIMGTTMAISYKSIVIRQKMPVWKIFYKIVKRSLTLFIIGLILNSQGNANFKKLRIPGVLQRFGITYLVVASAHVLSLLLHKGELFGALRIHHLIDIIPYWPEWLVMTIMGAIYFGLTFGWEFDSNCPVGYVGPGGLYNNASHIMCTGGAANYIDQRLLGKAHIYQHFTAAELYDPHKKFGISHDPEGVLGCTTSIILTFLGLQVGKILIAYPNPRQRITRWVVWGLLLAGLTTLFAATDWIPINKNLWSFSFICLCASAACFAISVLYYVIDVIKVWPNGQPFHYPGMNSILLYIGHGICGSMIPWTFNVDDTSHVGLLARNLVGVTLWFIISIVLAHKGFFLTV